MTSRFIPKTAGGVVRVCTSTRVTATNLPSPALPWWCGAGVYQHKCHRDSPTITSPTITSPTITTTVLPSPAQAPAPTTPATRCNALQHTAVRVAAAQAPTLTTRQSSMPQVFSCSVLQQFAVGCVSQCLGELKDVTGSVLQCVAAFCIGAVCCSVLCVAVILQLLVHRLRRLC